MYKQPFHRDRKYFCCYFLLSFSTAQILKRHANDCFKINDKQKIEIVQKVKTLKFKNYMKKIKSQFMIYEDVGSTLVPGNNGKQNLDESHTKTNIKIILVAVLVVNSYLVLTINSASHI